MLAVEKNPPLPPLPPLQLKLILKLPLPPLPDVSYLLNRLVVTAAAAAAAKSVNPQRGVNQRRTSGGCGELLHGGHQ